MNNLINEVVMKLTLLKNKEQFIRNFLKTAPEGRISINQKSEKNTIYSWVHTNEKKTEIGRTYIPKADNSLIDSLIQKSYYQNIQKPISEEINALEHFINHYHPDKKHTIYDNLSPIRKQHVNNLFPTAQDKVQAWLSQQWTSSKKFPENLQYETDNGELVRSKSELYIANQLHLNKEHCLYHYEQPLYLPKGSLTFEPDFTIINLHTGEIFIWEHFGMMDNSDYASEFVMKYNIYYENGYIPGKNFIMTFETSNSHLMTNIVKSNLKRYFSVN